MKTKYIAMAVLALSTGMVWTGCSDTPDAYKVAGGKPTVKYVRCLSSEVVGSNDEPGTLYTDGQLVTSAFPEAIVCLVGENLRSVYELYFNDQKAVLNTSYITDNALLVQVPSGIPELVSNKIYMVTKSQDTVTYDFSVTISAPTVTAMDCEYTPEGETTTITGRYMIDDPNVPLTVAFKDATGNDLFAEIKNIADDYTSVTVVVPEGAAEGPVTVTSIYGATASSFHYADTRGLLFDFDGVTGLGNHGWHNRDIYSDETSITGNFVVLGGAALDAEAGWNDGNYSFEYWPGNWEDPETFTAADGRLLTDLADFSDYSNMSLKFEMYVPSSNPWSAGAMQIIPADISTVSYGSAGAVDLNGTVLGGCNNTYISGSVTPRALYRPWTTTGSFDTGDKWITVSIPMNAATFAYGPDGTAATGSLSADSWASLVIFVFGGGVSGTECNPIIKIDNIRAVPNK